MGDRRTFIAGMLAAGVVPKLTWAEVGNPAFLSAGMKRDGQHVLCGLTNVGQITFEVALPSRGHAAAAHPLQPEAVAFARRPGTFAIVLDCVTGREKSRLHAPVGRHFYGHGVYSEDGELLFTTENDFESAQGVIGIWDAKDKYRRLGEFFSGGTGPHDIKLMPDRNTLVVANGGIETHPEAGRTKLNIATMRPNLSYVSLKGVVYEQIELDHSLRKHSIRHLDVAANGLVAFAMQWQGDTSKSPPVLGLHKRGLSPEILEPKTHMKERMLGYAGSVAITDDGRRIAVTSPRGNLCQIFDIKTRRITDYLALEDVCGVAGNAEGLIVTSGFGVVQAISHTGRHTTAKHSVCWDNHLLCLQI